MRLLELVNTPLAYLIPTLKNLKNDFKKYISETNRVVRKTNFGPPISVTNITLAY